MQKRFLRSRTDRVIAGVCGGLAQYLDQDPTLVRLVFAVAAVASAGFAIAGYLLLWVITPEEGARTSSERPVQSPRLSEEQAVSSAEGGELLPAPDDSGAPAEELETPVPAKASRQRDLHFLGWILLAVGVYFLLQALGIHSLARSLWPLVLVVVGVLLLWPHFRGR